MILRMWWTLLRLSRIDLNCRFRSEHRKTKTTGRKHHGIACSTRKYEFRRLCSWQFIAAGLRALQAFGSSNKMWGWACSYIKVRSRLLHILFFARRYNISLKVLGIMSLVFKFIKENRVNILASSWRVSRRSRSMLSSASPLRRSADHIRPQHERKFIWSASPSTRAQLQRRRIHSLRLTRASFCRASCLRVHQHGPFCISHQTTNPLVWSGLTHTVGGTR